ncbi:MAG: glycosyltransferase family 2 protein [Patescibacteria group bacterium]
MIVAIIPAYNEEKMIGGVVTSLKPLVDKIIVIDDGSTDHTKLLAESAGAIVLRHIINCGYGAALATGTAYAVELQADVIVHFDADGQFVANEVEKLVAPLKQGQAEVAFGSRFLGQAVNISLLRKLILKTAVGFTWAWSGIKLTDVQNGFRAFTREAARQINIRQIGKAATSEIIDEVARLGLKYTEVPVTVHYTDYSLNKTKANSIIDVWRIVRDLLVGKIIK